MCPAGDPCGFNKGRISKFHEGSRVRQTPEEGWRIYRPKRCRNNNKDDDNSPKTLNDENHQASSQIFRQVGSIRIYIKTPIYKANLFVRQRKKNSTNSYRTIINIFRRVIFHFIRWRIGCLFFFVVVFYLFYFFFVVFFFFFRETNEYFPV